MSLASSVLLGVASMESSIWPPTFFSSLKFISSVLKSSAAMVSLVYARRELVLLSLLQVLGDMLPGVLHHLTQLGIVLDHRPTAERDGGQWFEAQRSPGS